MKLKDLKQEELEAMGYDDLAYLVLKTENKRMRITDLFKIVCNLLKLSDSEYETKIGDFFELLSTDKKFIMLEDGHWDLREKHTNKIKIELDEEDALSDITEELENDDNDDISDEDDNTNIFYEADDSDDEPDNDLKDLVVIDDEEEANGLN